MKLSVWYSTACLALIAYTMFGSVTPVCAQAEPAGAKGSSGTEITLLMKKTLSGIAGKESMMLTIEYAPGASSSKHRHNAHTFVYVLEGSIVMQVEGEQAVTVAAGQTFYESPRDIHAVSKNASATERAKFLVFLVKDEGKPILVPVEE